MFGIEKEKRRLSFLSKSINTFIVSSIYFHSPTAKNQKKLLFYQEACKFNIQKENWTEFIEAAFRNPIKYLRKKTNSIMLREKIKKIVN